MTKTVWVLTHEVNEYDQYGEYFVAVFADKPSPEILKNAIINKGSLSFDGYRTKLDNLLTHILNGGGRQDSEYEWFNLNEVGVSA